MIFSRERRCYDRSELSTHRRVGDQDDKSHKGHPLCEFCDVRYMDSDELYRHLRRDHFFCHFCDADGHHYYFNDYPDLKEHFLKEHFLCQEENCINEQFTSVFRTEIDLKAHMASTHGRTLGKQATKQAKKIELELNFPARSNQRGRGNDTRYHPGEPSRQNLIEPTPSYHPATPVDINSEEFPSLGGAAPIVPVHNARRRQVQEAFPALGPVDNTSNAATAVNGREKWTAPKPRAPPPTASSRMTPSLPSSSQDFPSLPSTSTVSQAQALSWTGVAKTKKAPPPSPSKAPVKKPSKTVLSISKNIQNRSNNAQSAANGNQKIPVSNTNGRTANHANSRSKTTSSRERYSDEDDYNFHDDDISQYNLNSRTLPPQAFSKVTLIKSAQAQSAPVSQNNMNSANVEEDGAEIPTGGAAASTSKKVKMKGRLKGEDFPVLETAPRAAPTVQSSGGSPSGAAKLEYTLPPNFAARNASLFENIRRHIGHALDDFKSMSSLFMRQGLTAEEYYAYCLTNLGRNAFNEIFPELLVLLPMIDRQKELWRIHHSNASAKNKKVVSRLDQCAVCGQVIALAELKHHLDAHKKAGITQQPPPRTAQKKVPSAWGK